MFLKLWCRLTVDGREHLPASGAFILAPTHRSIIDTPVNRADMPDADFSRWVRPGQIGDAIVFLLSDAAEAVTGALIPIVGRV